MRTRALIAVAIATLALPCIAHGKPPVKPPVVSNYTVYTDKVSFLAAVGEVVFQGFEGSPEFACPPYGTSYENAGATFESASFSATNFDETGTSFACAAEVGNGPAAYATEGTHFLAVGNWVGYKWTLNFNILDSRSVYAVGFYLVDAAQTGDAVFIGPDGTRITMVECCQTDFSQRFFGVVSKKPMASFSIDPTASNDGYAIDELMLWFGRSKKPR